MDAISQSQEATLERFNAQQDRKARDMGFGDTEGALGITRNCLEPLTRYIEDRTKVAPENSEERMVLDVIGKLPAEVIALAALNAGLHSVAIGAPMSSAAGVVGSTIHGECWAAGLLSQDPELAQRIDRVVRVKHGNLKYRKQAARSIAGRAGYKGERWPQREVMAAGRLLIDYLLQALPDVFVKEREGVLEDGHEVLTITPEALEVAEAAVEQALQRSCVFLPSDAPPAPWADWYDGGYWNRTSRFKAPLVRTYYKQSVSALRAAFKAGAMQPHVEAVNRLQAVAWKVNERVLGVLKWAYENDVAIKGLPRLTDIPLPTNDGNWVTMPDAQKRAWKIKAAKVKTANRTLRGQRIMLKKDVTTAELMSAAGRFWTPMNCDWRGRIYAIPSFNFARDDRVRALFLFADGKPIGEEGLRWLKVHVANCGDFDKVSKSSIEERVRWTDENFAKIEQMTWTPTKDLWWSKADKPFLFLAACFELTSAMATGSSWLTRLPISFDGSCSGLQHLSAMTRDEKTARMVNLLPSEKPQDVYQTVAESVLIRVQCDASSPSSAPFASIAQLWLKHGVTRKLVKRNVMTYSYSSKKFGMASQLMEDLMRPLDLEVLAGTLKAHPFATAGDCYTDKDGNEHRHPDGYAASKYLAAIIYESIEHLVQLPAQAMAMLQKCARALAHEGKPVTWTTPLGLPWINRYHKSNVHRLDLWLHDTRIQMNYADGHKPEIDKDRAANGVAPNFVHACDAAHLLMVANACACEDITQLATVHDSFGCLAPDAPRFRGIIREQFVRLYEEHDVLQEVLEQSTCDLTVHNRQRLPLAPNPGALNLKEVLNADYAFA